MFLRTKCPTDKLLRVKDNYIIRSTTGRLSPPRMLDATNALNKVTLRNVCRAKSRTNMVNEVELAETSSSAFEVFLGEVSANEHKPWKPTS